MRTYSEFEGIELNTGVCLYDLNRIELRTLREALYLVEYNYSIRVSARDLCVSKSTLHRDVNNVLPHLSIELYDQVRTILKKHRDIRYHK